MNADYLAQFYETIGYKVIRTESSYWYSASKRIYRSLPADRVLDPSEEELQGLFRRYRLLGVQFPNRRKGGWESSLFVVRDRNYGLHSLQRQFRQHVKKGLEQCEVREIDFDELHGVGMPVNIDAMARREYTIHHFVTPKLWRRFCDAGKGTPGAGALGSFVQGKLASYLVYFIVDKTCHGLHMMSRTDMRGYRPNHLLYYTFTRGMITRKGIELVTTGLQSIPSLGQVDQFKRHAGYQQEPYYISVVLRPLANLLLLNSVTSLVLNSGGRMVGRLPLLRHIRPMLDVARLTQAR